MKMTINLRNVFGCLCVFLSTAASGQQLKADDNAIVKSGNARFTVLPPEMIRIEYSDKGVFEDRATFVVQNRKMDVVPSFTKSEDNDFVYITTDKLTLKYRKNTDPRTIPASPANLSVVMKHNGQDV